MLTYKDYIKDVQSGKIAVCEYIRLAVDRHTKDLKQLDKKQFKFVPELAAYYINFIQDLKLSKGKAAGQNIKLMPWQQFMIAMLFGWLEKREGEWVRRYRKCYIEVPRKNGKSTIAAAVALCCFVADREGGPEVYCAATSRKQASIVFNEIKSMIRQNDHLSEFLEVLSKSIAFMDKSVGTITTLASNSEKMSGLNTHCAIIDELHEHPNRGIVDIVTTSTSARAQPLIFEITTAGKRLDRVCYEHHKYSADILRGIQKDENWFSMIFTIDKGDDWESTATWHKANPNLGVPGAKSLEYMMAEYNEAKTSTSKANAFKQLDLNVWVFGSDGWIDDGIWGKQEVEQIDWSYVNSLPCWAGLDLAQTKDFSALSLLYWDESAKKFYLKFIKWAAEDNIKDMAYKFEPSLLQWAEQGYIRMTDGNVMDADLIESEIIKEIKSIPNFQSLAYDRTFAHQMVLHFEREGIRCQPYSQAVTNMAPPTAGIEADIRNLMMIHEPDPVFRWMLSNAQVKRINDMPKIVRNSTKFKIDAVIALIMAYGQFLTEKLQPKKTSVYSTRGIIVVGKNSR